MSGTTTASIILCAAVVAVGCASSVDEDGTTRDSAGEVVEGGEVGALRLQVGDCLAEEQIGDIESVPVVPCDQPHDSELFHTFDMPDSDYPGDEAVIEAAQQGCLDAFEGFVGAPYETSIYDISYIYPVESSWDVVGDRTVICGVYLVDGTLAVGSAADAGE